MRIGIVIMKRIKNEKGIALVTALLLTLIGLAIILAAIYMVTRGITISGLEKRYQTALEASHGGAEIIAKEFIPNVMGSSLSGFVNSLTASYRDKINVLPSDACFSNKLRLVPTSWGCSDTSVTNLNTAYDIRFTFSGVAPQPNFYVYTKIVDTVPGNTSTSGIDLEGLGVVEAGSGIITPQHFPYMYRIEVQGERQTNPDERANLSVLYAY